jgi:hypothetical protein
MAKASFLGVDSFGRFATGCGYVRAAQGAVKHGRWNGYGAPDLCVMQVPPAYFHFYSMPRVGNLAFLRPNNSILAFLFLVWPWKKCLAFWLYFGLFLNWQEFSLFLSIIYY